MASSHSSSRADLVSVAVREWPIVGHLAGLVVADQRNSLIALLDVGEIDALIAKLTAAKDELLRIAAGQPSGKLQ